MHRSALYPTWTQPEAWHYYSPVEFTMPSGYWTAFYRTWNLRGRWWQG